MGASTNSAHWGVTTSAGPVRVMFGYNCPYRVGGPIPVHCGPPGLRSMPPAAVTLPPPPRGRANTVEGLCTRSSPGKDLREVPVVGDQGGL